MNYDRMDKSLVTTDDGAQFKVSFGIDVLERRCWVFTEVSHPEKRRHIGPEYVKTLSADEICDMVEEWWKRRRKELGEA